MNPFPDIFAEMVVLPLFATIVGALSLSLSHIEGETMGLITISVSTYMIIYSHPLYERPAPWLGIFERNRPHHEIEQDDVAPFTGGTMILNRAGTHE